MDEVGTVYNGQYDYYFISFCVEDMPSNQNYQSVISVASDPTTKRGAFDLITCAVNSIPNVEDCTFDNYGYPGIVVQQLATSITSITLASTQINMGDGLWIGVFGYGGEVSKLNNYQVFVQESPI